MGGKNKQVIALCRPSTGRNFKTRWMRREGGIADPEKPVSLPCIQQGAKQWAEKRPRQLAFIHAGLLQICYPRRKGKGEWKVRWGSVPDFITGYKYALLKQLNNFALLLSLVVIIMARYKDSVSTTAHPTQARECLRQKFS